jgi:serine/threonine protein kinase
VEQVVISQESDVQVTFEKFAVTRSGARPSCSWRRRYILGRELGAGQTAVVFEAYATSDGGEDIAEWQPSSQESSASQKPGGVASLGRRVALKRLNGVGTSMFRQEVRALLQVGVHPHILRLLECFCDGEDDILVLEYCEGGDVYELYARNNGVGMPEAFVAQLIRQILMALHHLAVRGVEHRDVKPENLLLYGPCHDGSSAPHVKLADFGWASLVTPHKQPAPIPTDGVGSLWYAPPELNPPVQGVGLDNTDAPIGRSDMWSVGIIAYLLLVGHSPFNLALRIQDPAAREAEVLRLAALGVVNSNARPWNRLSQEARHFITALIQPKASVRMSAEQAWAHEFVSRHSEAGATAPRSLPTSVDKLQVWRGLDGFQRLSWMSIARAVAEPELLEGVVFRLLIAGQNLDSQGPPYLEQLACDLAGTAVPAWFHTNTAWADVLRLAFRYLDCDGDGVLGIGDLMRHILSEEAEKVSGTWFLRWQCSPVDSQKATAQPAGLTYSDFRLALWSTLTLRKRVQELSQSREGPRSGSDADPGKKPFPSNGEDSAEAALLFRMMSIEEVCDQFVEAEGTSYVFSDNSATWPDIDPAQ